MSLSSWLHFWRSWGARLSQRWLQRCPSERKVFQDGHDHRSGEQLGPALESAGQPGSTNQAIFEMGSRVGRSLTARGSRPLADDRDVQQELEQAVGLVLSSLDIRARVLDRDHLLQIALRLNDLAAREKEQGRYPLTEALCQRALDIFDKVAVPDHPELLEVLENYADLLHCVGRAPEAAPLEARAAGIRINQAKASSFGGLSPGPDSRIQPKGFKFSSGIRSRGEGI